MRTQRLSLHKGRLTKLAVTAAGVALLATACSSSSNTASGGSAGTPAATSGAAAGGGSSSGGSSSGALVHVASSKFGSILVDSKGKTLYGFAADKPGVSNCSGTCLQYWPLVKAPATLPSSLPGVTGKIGEITRSDGTRQLTIDDLPVYTYAGDGGPGQTSGQGLNLSGGLWWVIAPSGKWITSNAPASSAPAGGSGGGGNGY